MPLAQVLIGADVYVAGRIRLAPGHRAPRPDIAYRVFVLDHALWEPALPRAHRTVSEIRLSTVAALYSRLCRSLVVCPFILIQPWRDAKPHVDPTRLWSNLAYVFAEHFPLPNIQFSVLRRSSVFPCNFSWFSASGRVRFPDIPGTCLGTEILHLLTVSHRNIPITVILVRRIINCRVCMVSKLTSVLNSCFWLLGNLFPRRVSSLLVATNASFEIFLDAKIVYFAKA